MPIKNANFYLFNIGIILFQGSFCLLGFLTFVFPLLSLQPFLWHLSFFFFGASFLGFSQSVDVSLPKSLVKETSFSGVMVFSANFVGLDMGDSSFFYWVWMIFEDILHPLRSSNFIKSVGGGFRRFSSGFRWFSRGISLSLSLLLAFSLYPCYLMFFFSKILKMGSNWVRASKGDLGGWEDRDNPGILHPLLAFGTHKSEKKMM